MANMLEIQGREFAKGIAEMKKTQSRRDRGSRNRRGMALRNYFTTDNSNTKSRMRPVADLKQMPIDQEQMLFALWEIVRTS